MREGEGERGRERGGGREGEGERGRERGGGREGEGERGRERGGGREGEGEREREREREREGEREREREREKAESCAIYQCTCQLFVIADMLCTWMNLIFCFLIAILQVNNVIVNEAMNSYRSGRGQRIAIVVDEVNE